MISHFSLRLCQKSCLKAETLPNCLVGEGKKLHLPFFYLYIYFLDIGILRPKYLKFGQNRGISALKSRYMEKFSKDKKNGRWSFLPVSQHHFDQISATYHAFWQILSKKCEIIENRKKMQKSKIWVKSYFFHTFKVKVSFLTLNQENLLSYSFWVSFGSWDKIILKLRTKKAHFKLIFALKRVNFQNLRHKYPQTIAF